MRVLNRKARLLLSRAAPNARAYAVSDCCPAFAPGWEVAFDGTVDPCPWQADLPACHPCFWSGQVPDSTNYPGWLDGCPLISRDWRTLCTVPDLG